MTRGDDTKVRGVFVQKGSGVRVPSLTISMDEAGSLTAGPIPLELRTDLTPTFIEASLDRLEFRAAFHRLLNAHACDDEGAMSDAMRDDCRASLQCITASAGAIEAFYSAVTLTGDFVPNKIRNAWAAKRTARRKRVGETLRRAFKQSPQGARLAHRILRDVYQWRDWAVHPNTDFSRPAHYGEIERAVDIRLSQFRYRNSLGAVGGTLVLINGLVQHAKPQSDLLKDYAENLRERIADPIRRWDERYLEDAKAAE